MIEIFLPFSCRKRILATGSSSLLRIQQPDSTVISEPSSKENSGFSFDTSSFSVPLDSRKPPQIRRVSAVSVDYDTDHSDSIIDVNPMYSKHSRTIHVENESICDSPSAQILTNSCFNLSKKTSMDMDASDLFFSPKEPKIVVQNKPKLSAPEDIEPDDFYIDDFDIDDLNDSDIPEYFEEPQTSSLPPQNSGTTPRTVKEGSGSKSIWERSPTTPAPKPSKICSPGKDSRAVLYSASIL